MDRAELERVREWAINKLTTGGEPPWSWYRYMQLREALEALLEGMAVTRPMEISPESAERPDVSLRLVASTRSQDTVQSHPERGPRPPLPM
jgi:hypothetical protein